MKTLYNTSFELPVTIHIYSTKHKALRGTGEKYLKHLAGVEPTTSWFPVTMLYHWYRNTLWIPCIHVFWIFGRYAHIMIMLRNQEESDALYGAFMKCFSMSSQIDACVYAYIRFHVYIYSAIRSDKTIILQWKKRFCYSY